jgi:hypothetical protein
MDPPFAVLDAEQLILNYGPVETKLRLIVVYLREVRFRRANL